LFAPAPSQGFFVFYNKNNVRTPHLTDEF
jgi:hypothetical protein